MQLTGNLTISDCVLHSLCLGPHLRFMVLSFLCLLFAIGVVGNTLTLLALPYVRRKYGAQFSVLKSSTVVLLLHLSVCDLLYISVGFTHFIHVLIVGKVYAVLFFVMEICLQMVIHFLRLVFLLGRNCVTYWP